MTSKGSNDLEGGGRCLLQGTTPAIACKNTEEEHKNLPREQPITRPWFETDSSLVQDRNIVRVSKHDFCQQRRSIYHAFMARGLGAGTTLHSRPENNATHRTTDDAFRRHIRVAKTPLELITCLHFPFCDGCNRCDRSRVQRDCLQCR